MKYYPPDTKACIFWLTNRRPDLWSDKVRIDVSKAEDGPANSEVEYRITPEVEDVLRRIAVITHRLEQEQEQQDNDPA